MSNKLSFVPDNYRTCVVKNKNALFHCWQDKAWVVGASPMIGGTPAGQMRMTLGIIEYEDGTIHECYPDEIRFTDGLTSCYAFENDMRKQNEKI